jgi:hypothetical protein
MFYLWNIFPQGPENNISVISRIFCENHGDIRKSRCTAGGKFCHWYLVPLVLLILVVHLELRISTNFPKRLKQQSKWNGLLRGLGETNLWNNLKSKISWHCPFNDERKVLLLIQLIFCNKKFDFLKDCHRSWTGSNPLCLRGSRSSPNSWYGSALHIA